MASIDERLEKLKRLKSSVRIWLWAMKITKKKES